MGEEEPLVERLSQEVRRILLGRNERHTKLESLNHIANVEMAPLNALGTLVILRVVGEVARGLIVRGELGWAGDGGSGRPHMRGTQHKYYLYIFICNATVAGF